MLILPLPRFVKNRPVLTVSGFLGEPDKYRGGRGVIQLP